MGRIVAHTGTPLKIQTVKSLKIHHRIWHFTLAVKRFLCSLGMSASGSKQERFFHITFPFCAVKDTTLAKCLSAIVYTGRRKNSSLSLSHLNTFPSFSFDFLFVFPSLHFLKEFFNLLIGFLSILLYHCILNLLGLIYRHTEAGFEEWIYYFKLLPMTKKFLKKH